jgi:hypothetical protein
MQNGVPCEQPGNGGAVDPVAAAQSGSEEAARVAAEEAAAQAEADRLAAKAACRASLQSHGIEIPADKQVVSLGRGEQHLCSVEWGCNMEMVQRRVGKICQDGEITTEYLNAPYRNEPYCSDFCLGPDGGGENGLRTDADKAVSRAPENTSHQVGSRVSVKQRACAKISFINRG